MCFTFSPLLDVASKEPAPTTEAVVEGTLLELEVNIIFSPSQLLR